SAPLPVKRSSVCPFAFLLLFSTYYHQKRSEPPLLSTASSSRVTFFASFDYTPLSSIIWRGVFLACSFEVLHKNRLPNFQGEIKMRGVMWDLLSQLFAHRKRHRLT